MFTVLNVVRNIACLSVRSPMQKKNLNTKLGTLLLPVVFSLSVCRMNGSTCSVASQNGPQSVAQRKFYQWVLKWINGIQTDSESSLEEPRNSPNSTKPDVPTLASFLQAIGFKLRSFEKHSDAIIQRKDEEDVSTPKSGVLKISIECGTSNMRAILELGEVTCRCPNPDHVKDASFWSVTGTGPTGSIDNIVHKVEETGCNLLPRLSKDIIQVTRDVSTRLFKTIACEPDVNRNTDTCLNLSRSSSTNYEFKASQESLRKGIGVVRSYTQPEMPFRANSMTSKNSSVNQERNRNSESCKPALQRQKTWDIDIETGSLDGEPRPSPPKLTSSPAIVAELSNSLGQISLPSDIDNPKNVTEYIVGAHKNLEKALKMLLIKKPTILNDLSPNQDCDRVSVKSAPPNISPTVFVSPYKPTRLSSVSSGVKPLSKINPLTHEQQSLTKPNSRNVVQTSKARRSIEATLSKPMTRRSLQSEQESSKQMIRRNSHYLPSSANSNLSLLSKPSDTGQKFFGSGKFSTSRTNIAAESDSSNRTYMLGRRVVSPEPRTTSPNIETFNAPNGRATSMIKPPKKISKSIPVKIKPIPASKMNSGIAKKSRIISKD